MKRHRAAWVLGLIALPMFSIGCGGVSARKRFYAYDYPNAKEGLLKEYKKALGKETHRDYALASVGVAQASVDGGDYAGGKKYLRKAAKVMERTEVKGRAVAATIGSDARRTYQGVAYERAMSHFFTGMLYYLDGDYERALAAFRRSIEADGTTHTKKEEHQKDFRLAYFFAGRCYDKLGEPGNARVNFEKAGTPEEMNSQSNNLIVVVAANKGPVKLLNSRDTSMWYWGCPPQEIGGVTVYVDGKPVGQGRLLIDLYRQASQETVSGRDIARVAKGIIRDEVASRIPILGLFIRRPTADTRTWDLLPRHFYVVTARVRPGKHTIALSFSEPEKQAKYYAQRWYYVAVRREGDTLLYFRAGKNKCNLSASARMKADKSRTYPVVPSAEKSGRKASRQMIEKPVEPPKIVYCNSALGHRKGAKPFILGGTCCCTPAKVLMDSYHADSILLGKNVGDLVRMYKDAGIVTDLDPGYAGSNNMDDHGPHVVKGGKSMVTPTPGTRNYEEVIFGYTGISAGSDSKGK